MSFDYSTTTTGEMPAGLGAAYYIVMIVIGVIAIIATWKIFTKAGEAGWKCLIPIYNLYTEIKLFWDTNPVLMTVLMFVPLVNIVIALILSYKMCAAFGKGVGFFILMLLFAPIAYLILAFGNDDYIGPQ